MPRTVYTNTLPDLLRKHATGAAMALAFALGAVDFLTGYEIGFFVFYYIPIALAAWYGSRRAGVGLAIVCGLIWLASDLLSGHTYRLAVLQVWNTAVRMMAFLVLAIAISRGRAHFDKQKRLTDELSQALSEVKQLKGLLPICSWCKQVRNDQGYWEQIEAYVATRTDAEFTHGICPECARRLQKQ